MAAVGVDADLGLRGPSPQPADAARRGRRAAGRRPVVDVDDPGFLPPGDMPARIAQALPRRGAARVPETPAEIVRCILDSLAAAFAAAIRRGRAARPASRSTSSTSSAAARRTSCCASSPPTPAGLPVLAGPVEATALGNVLVQARAHGVLAGDLWALRERIRRTVTLTRYEPRAPAR